MGKKKTKVRRRVELLIVLLKWSVVKKFFNEIHVAEQHSPAAVPLQA
jgi:hypothetical protein